MNDRPDPRLVKLLTNFASMAALFSVAVGLWGLAGWWLHIPGLTTWGAASVGMKANASLCFVLTGFSLCLLRKRRKRSFAWVTTIAAKVSASVVGLMGLLSLVEYVSVWDFGIDRFLSLSPPGLEAGSSRAGLMSPLTAAAFVLVSLALLGIDWRTRRGRWPAQFLSLSAGAIATFGLLTFAFDPLIYDAHLSLALPTSVTLALLSLGLVCVRTEWGLGALLCSQSLGGCLARRLLPAAFIPILVGGIRWGISALGLYSEWSIVVLTSLITMSLLAGVFAWAAEAVDLDDMGRRGADEVRARLAAAFDSSDDAIICKTLEGTITAWNCGAEKVFGYSTSEAVGKTMLMLMPDDRVCEEPDILRHIARGESVEHFETVRVRKDGREINVSETISPIKDAGGTVIGAAKIARDITDRKHTEKRLAGQAEELSRRTEELLRSRQALASEKMTLQSVLGSMGEGLVAVDGEGKFLLWNAAAEKMLGRDAANVGTHEWAEHFGLYLPDTVTPFPSDDLPVIRALNGELRASEMFVRNSALPEGAWIEVSGGPRTDSNGITCGAVVAFRDITRRKADEREIGRLNEELERRVSERTAQLAAANLELEAFTYSVSHDLRAPLRHIGGFAKILIEDFGAAMDPEARRHLERIGDGVHRMGLLVDELLNLARVGRHPVQLQATGLNSMIEEVLCLLQPEAEGRAVAWKIAELPSVECDPILIKQVFQNLLANALKFTRTRACAVIKISQQQENGEMVIAVSDNGVGFDMKYQDKLFGVFQRLHRAEDFEGTGIGLATVKRIIHKHGGRVWAEAELDKGATFYFTLGAKPAPANPEWDHPDNAKPMEIENKSAAAGAQS